MPRTFQFTYGKPFALFFSLLAKTGTRSPDGFHTAMGQGTGIADFSNTLVLTALEVSDSNNNPLSGPPTFTSVSGAEYSTDGVLTSFEHFSAHAELESHQGEFEANGTFLLGSGSNGIDPLTEDVDTGCASAPLHPSMRSFSW